MTQSKERNTFFKGICNGRYDLPEDATIESLVEEIQKDYENASKPYMTYSYMTSMTKAIVNGFSKEEYLKSFEMFGLRFTEGKIEEFHATWSFCINDLNDEVRGYHEAWAEEQMLSIDLVEELELN